MFLVDGINGAVFAEVLRLLIYTSYSLSRLIIALIISYIFGILYGIAAARSRRSESALLPILDVLQSVPILGFFPAAIFFFIAIFEQSWLGIELAAIFLIFTCQAWNLAFSTYESVSSIPNDLREASNAFHLKGLSRFRNLILPACVPKLVYNGMMSWAGGWYFLVAAEIIILGSTTYNLPGIGSYIAGSVYSANIIGTIIGLFFLILAVLAFDLLIWRPLRNYAENFRYEPVIIERTKIRSFLPTSTLARISSLTPRLALSSQYLPEHVPSRVRDIAGSMHYITKKPQTFLAKHGRFILFFSIISVILIVIIISIQQVLFYIPILPRISESIMRDILLIQELSVIPIALGSSLIRLFLAYVLSVAWTLPLAVLIASKRKNFGTNMFIIQVLAAIPATAIFPIIILATIDLPGGIQLTSVILTMTGMQWYLLFNLIGGMIAIPSDLIETSNMHKLTGVNKWKKLILPAVMPSFVTGSITAWGGGWNALVITEYIVFGNDIFAVLGIGALLDIAAYELGSVSLLLLIIVIMVATIMIIDKLIWRPLYNYVLSKYLME
ncbi:ABC transporter permease subunit [Candidatus Bathyarchaeota archaeon]|nr:ABC transporter permease subunit [Candidatus Bathyarchaeota archaeon]